MLRRRWNNFYADEQGSASVEGALVMSTLVIVVAAMIAALATLAAYIAAVDTAGAAARAQAIGVEYSPPRGEIRVTENSGLMTVTASIPSPLGSMEAQAVFPKEIP